jgi:GntR family transcriptional regulator, transcriptional repressor for pyruvate dehydrogenase complex
MPIQKTKLSLVKTTADKIIDMIKTQNLQPGGKLPTEYELAEMFGVGRSTLREAVKALASNNILLIRQGSGTFVSDKQGIANDPLGLSLLDNNTALALDMLTVRLIFEPAMASMAAINAAPQDYRRINEACAIVEDLVKQNKNYSAEDSAFHEAIATASGNKIISKIVQVIHASIQKNIFVTEDALRDKTLIYHRQIAEAIKNGDADGARYTMITHLNELRLYMIKKQQQDTENNL